MDHSAKIEKLRSQGVSIPAPATLEIGDEVDLTQVRGPGTVLHLGTKLYGKDLLILPGARVGYEEPATIESCAVGRDVKLSGGYFAGSVFLDRVVMGKGAHVRSGTLMEEESNGAHCVGLKQTVLLPYVTLGSLINFCDALMAGGKSRKDHSEVGSSFIHFNFTPFGRNGDKATPSLIGDVPRGVMLRAPRIFLGGQAGLIGPVHIDYGTVLAAGFVYRRDYGPGQLVVGESLGARTVPFTPLRYQRIRSKVKKNLRYLGNLIALWHWYGQVRLPAAGSDEDRRLLYARARAALDECVEERIRRLGQIAGYMEDSIRELQRDGESTSATSEINDQRAFAERWPEVESALRGYPARGALGSPGFERFQQSLQSCLSGGAADYLALIQAIPAEAREAGTTWLQQIVDDIEGLLF